MKANTVKMIQEMIQYGVENVEDFNTMFDIGSIINNQLIYLGVSEPEVKEFWRAVCSASCLDNKPMTEIVGIEYAEKYAVVVKHIKNSWQMPAWGYAGT